MPVLTMTPHTSAFGVPVASPAMGMLPATTGREETYHFPQTMVAGDYGYPTMEGMYYVPWPMMNVPTHEVQRYVDRQIPATTAAPTMMPPCFVSGGEQRRMHFLTHNGRSYSVDPTRCRSSSAKRTVELSEEQLLRLVQQQLVDAEQRRGTDWRDVRTVGEPPEAVNEEILTIARTLPGVSWRYEPYSTAVLSPRHSCGADGSFGTQDQTACRQTLSPTTRFIPALSKGQRSAPAIHDELSSTKANLPSSRRFPDASTQVSKRVVPSSTSSHDGSRQDEDYPLSPWELRHIAADYLRQLPQTSAPLQEWEISDQSTDSCATSQVSEKSPSKGRASKLTAHLLVRLHRRITRCECLLGVMEARNALLSNAALEDGARHTRLVGKKVGPLREAADVKYIYIIQNRCRKSHCCSSSMYSLNTLVVLDGDMGVEMGIIAYRIEKEEFLQMTATQRSQLELPTTLEPVLRIGIYAEATPQQAHLYYHWLPELEKETLLFLRSLWESDAESFKACNIQAMKFESCEFQADGQKLYVYYQSNSPVRFLELATFLNHIFKCRIWIHEH